MGRLVFGSEEANEIAAKDRMAEQLRQNEIDLADEDENHLSGGAPYEELANGPDWDPRNWPDEEQSDNSGIMRTIFGDGALAPKESDLSYDYSQVDEQARDMVIEWTLSIQRHSAVVKTSIVTIGERMIAVKDNLPHGQFGEWLRAEFDMSERMAQNIMNVAREYGGKSEIVSFLSDSILYLLAAPSTPEEAREKVETQVKETGKTPKRAEVKRIIRESKPSPTPTPAKAVYVEPKQAGWGKKVYGPGYPYEEQGWMIHVLSDGKIQAINGRTGEQTPALPTSQQVYQKLRLLFTQSLPDPSEDQAVTMLPKADLTPADLRDEGIIVEESPPNYFRWVDTDEARYRVGALHDTAEQAIASARHNFGIYETADAPEELSDTPADLAAVEEKPKPLSVPSLLDMRRPRARALRDVLIRARELARLNYGELTGRHTDMLEFERGIDAMLPPLERLIELLGGES